MMSDRQTREAIARWRAMPSVPRQFVGGHIDGETRECKSDRRVVRRDVYQLDDGVMRYRFTRSF
jgi:hypothetical protein